MGRENDKQVKKCKRLDGKAKEEIRDEFIQIQSRMGGKWERREVYKNLRGNAGDSA
jgi:hypothetical protein